MMRGYLLDGAVPPPPSGFPSGLILAASKRAASARRGHSHGPAGAARLFADGVPSDRLAAASHVEFDGLPSVLTADLDMSDAVRSGLDRLSAFGGIPLPSLIVVNDCKGSAQFQWLLDWRAVPDSGLPAAAGEQPDHARWRLYRETMRSLTALLKGDPLFQGRRMRNPWRRPREGSGVRMLVLGGRAPWYDPCALSAAVRDHGVWIPDARVFARARTHASIIRMAGASASAAARGPLTADDFACREPLRTGSRNSEAYRRLFAAAMHGVDPGEVMDRLSFEGSFPAGERRMLVRQVRRAAASTGAAPSDGAAASGLRRAPVHADALWRAMGRRRRRPSPQVSAVARGMRARVSCMSEEGRRRASRPLRARARLNAIGRLRLRGDVIDAYMTAAEGVVMTDRMVSRHVDRLNGRASGIGCAPRDPEMRALRNVRRELTAWASLLVDRRRGLLDPGFADALADPAVRGVPGVWPSLVIRAAVSVGFLDVLGAAGLVMLPAAAEAPASIPPVPDADGAFRAALAASAPSEARPGGRPRRWMDPGSVPVGGLRSPSRTPAIGVAAAGVLGGPDVMLLFSASPACRPPARPAGRARVLAALAGSVRAAVGVPRRRGACAVTRTWGPSPPAGSAP